MMECKSPHAFDHKTNVTTCLGQFRGEDFCNGTGLLPGMREECEVTIYRQPETMRQKSLESVQGE
jgi:hypothetical protein